jgi:hypothetical protein
MRTGDASGPSIPFSVEIVMKLKTLIAVAVASAFPCLALAQAATSQPQEGRTPPGTRASPGSIEDQSAKGAPGTGTSATGRTTGSAALFDRLDKNQDGFISRDEARDATELQGRFAELDKDNDGKISRSEIRSMDGGRGATGTTGSGTMGGSSTGMGGSTGGMGGSSGPAGTSSGPNPAGEAPRGGISK